MGERSKREGIYACIQPTHFIVQQKLTQRCKAIILFIKNNNQKHKLDMTIIGIVTETVHLLIFRHDLSVTLVFNHVP